MKQESNHGVRDLYLLHNRYFSDEKETDAFSRFLFITHYQLTILVWVTVNNVRASHNVMQHIALQKSCTLAQ